MDSTQGETGKQGTVGEAGPPGEPVSWYKITNMGQSDHYFCFVFCFIISNLDGKIVIFLVITKFSTYSFE